MIFEMPAATQEKFFLISIGNDVTIKVTSSVYSA